MIEVFKIKTKALKFNAIFSFSFFKFDFKIQIRRDFLKHLTRKFAIVFLKHLRTIKACLLRNEFCGICFQEIVKQFLKIGLQCVHVSSARFFL